MPRGQRQPGGDRAAAGKARPLNQALVTALADVAAAYARMLQPAQRVQVKQALGEAVTQANPGYAAALESAAAAFEIDRCGTLCGQ